MKKVLCLVVVLLVAVTGLLLHGLATGGEGIDHSAATATGPDTPARAARPSGDQSELKRIIRQQRE